MIINILKYKIMKKAKLIILLLVLFPLIGLAQITTKKVSFPKGKSGTTLSGTIKGYQSIDYTLLLSKGQVFKVNMSTKSTSCYFNILAPGSDDVAIYNSSNEGNNYTGTLSTSGVYKIRVYLYRNAARRGDSATFSLAISAKGGNSKSIDAKVPGTNYHATGDLRAANGSKTTSANFGVIRSKDGAEVHATMKGTNRKRVFVFSQGEWSCKSASCSLNFSKISSDEWELIVNNTEKYYIPDAVIFGG
jgi:hypothetical protein